MKHIKFFLLTCCLFLTTLISVNAEEINKVVDNEIYSDLSGLKDSITKEDYDIINEYFKNYIADNLDSNNIYVAIVNSFSSSSIDFYFITDPVTYNSGAVNSIFKYDGFGYRASLFDNRCTNFALINYNLSNKILSVNNTSSYCGLFYSVRRLYGCDGFVANKGLFWSSSPLTYPNELDKYYSYTFTNIPDYLSGYYNASYLAPLQPIYTYSDLLFGVRDSLPIIDYTVSYYYDDVLQPDLTVNGSAKSGTDISIEDKSNDYYLSNENNLSTFKLSESNNNIEIRYYSKNYGTVYQQINTHNSQLYFPFHYDYLKTLFPSINFDLWTSFEQFSFTLTFNLFFIVFLAFLIFLIIKLFYFIKGWFL